MQKLIRGTHGQSTAEYAIVIALVLGALVGMQTYVRRAINARLADAADNVIPNTEESVGTATQFSAATATRLYQFEPGYAKSDTLSTSDVGSAATPETASTITMTKNAVTGITGVTGDYGSRSDRSGTSDEAAYTP